MKGIHHSGTKSQQQYNEVVAFEVWNQIVLPVQSHTKSAESYGPDLRDQLFISIIGVNQLISDYFELNLELLPKLFDCWFFPHRLQLVRREPNQAQMLLQCRLAVHPDHLSFQFGHWQIWLQEQLFEKVQKLFLVVQILRMGIEGLEELFVGVVPLYHECRVPAGKDVRCVFFNAAEVHIFVKYEKYSSIHSIQILPHEGPGQSHSEQRSFNPAPQPYFPERAHFLSIQKVKHPFDDTHLIGTPQHLQQRSSLLCLLLSFHDLVTIYQLYFQKVTGGLYLGYIAFKINFPDIFCFGRVNFIYVEDLMDNKEGTVIGIGCLALCSLYYFYRQFSREAHSYKQRRRLLRKVKGDSGKNHHQIDFQSIKTDKAKVAVIIPNAQNVRLEADTYKLYYREVPKKMIPRVMSEGFVQNQTGGRFTIKYLGREVAVDIRNCNMETSVLQETRAANIIFEDNKNKEALYYSLTYGINSLKKLALYGTIKYSLSEQKFILEPQFILRALKSQEETADAIQAFWNDKIYRITFKKLVIGFSMLTLGYLLIYRPLKNIWQRYKARGEGVSEGQFDYFKEKVPFAARNESALNCEFCKTNSISYIYECGHLVACEECHLKNDGHRCPICSKKSKKHMKIFI